MTYYYLKRFLLWMLLWGLIALPKGLAQDDKIEILQAAELSGETINGVEIRKLKNNVIIRHKGQTLYCDSAYQNLQANNLEAFGNAKLVDSDGSVVTSKKMLYDGNTRFAKALGNVVLVDEQKVLETEQLDYDMSSKVAYYTVGGKITDPENVLTSQEGTYDTKSKIFYFKKNVVIISKKDGDRIDSDDLIYNTVTDIAYFQGPTRITTKDNDVLYANQGTYNTRTKVSNFKGRPKVVNEKYILEGDSLYYDNIKEFGIAIGNSQMLAKNDSILVNGDVSMFWGKEGRSKVYGKAIARQFSDKDTLFLIADTLISVNNDSTLQKYVLAFNHARVFRNQMQAVCDSLVYNRGDSTIYFFRNPILWSKDNQMTADSIRVQTANNKIKTAILRQNSFVISTDTLQNFNQVKGRYITAHFIESQIRRVDVNGNAESIYFAIEGDTVMTGMNRAECSDMKLIFKAQNKLQSITQYNKVDALFIPPHELEEPQKRLKGFIWRKEERPQKAEFDRRIRREAGVSIDETSQEKGG